MAEYPLKIFEKIDPELLNLVQNTNTLSTQVGTSFLKERIDRQFKKI